MKRYLDEGRYVGIPMQKRKGIWLLRDGLDILHANGAVVVNGE